MPDWYDECHDCGHYRGAHRVGDGWCIGKSTCTCLGFAETATDGYTCQCPEVGYHAWLSRHDTREECIEALRDAADELHDEAQDREDEAYRLDRLADELERPAAPPMSPEQVRMAWA